MRSKFYSTKYNFFDSGKIEQSPIDKQLSANLKDKYNIDVLCSDFSIVATPFGKKQAKFFLLVDAKNSAHPIGEALCRLSEARNYGANITTDKYGDSFHDFAQHLTEEYLKVSDITDKYYDDLAVIIYEFNGAAENYLYGKCLTEVKQYMSKNYNVDIHDIVGVEDGKYYVLVDTLKDFCKIVEKKALIRKDVFNILKKHDYFDLLYISRLKISFLLKDALDMDELSEYLRRRTLD